MLDLSTLSSLISVDQLFYLETFTRMKNPERSRQPDQLQSLSLRELQRFGMENFSSIHYRSEVMKRVAKTHRASRAILYDNVADAASDDNKDSSHFYERHLLPGLITASGFDQGAVAIVAAPPAEAEIKGIRHYKKKLEAELGKKVTYSIYYEQDGKVHDLLQTEQEEYRAIQKEARSNPTKAIKHGEQAEFIKRILSKDANSNDKVLIVPYQTNQGHYETFRDELKNNRVALPDIPEVDKAYNGL